MGALLRDTGFEVESLTKAEKYPPPMKQMADDLKAVAAKVAMAGERFDCSPLPGCVASLLRTANELTRVLEENGLMTEIWGPTQPEGALKIDDDWT
jgi:hypothetical protein